jgi:DNA-binding transcriptional LysR family regulator
VADYEWLIAPGPGRAIWAIYPPKKVVPPKVRTFVAFLLVGVAAPTFHREPRTMRIFRMFNGNT